MCLAFFKVQWIIVRSHDDYRLNFKNAAYLRTSAEMTSVFGQSWKVIWCSTEDYQTLTLACWGVSSTSSPTISDDAHPTIRNDNTLTPLHYRNLMSTSASIVRVVSNSWTYLLFQLWHNDIHIFFSNGETAIAVYSLALCRRADNGSHFVTLDPRDTHDQWPMTQSQTMTRVEHDSRITMSDLGLQTSGWAHV